MGEGGGDPYADGLIFFCGGDPYLSPPSLTCPHHPSSRGCAHVSQKKSTRGILAAPDGEGGGTQDPPLP